MPVFSSLFLFFADEEHASYFTGLIDEVAIYNYALPTVVVQAHNALRQQPPPDSTYANVTFDEDTVGGESLARMLVFASATSSPAPVYEEFLTGGK